MSLLKIISGGQTGADIAALRVAAELGFQTGGWMPRGFKTLAGSKPEYVDLYNVHENDSPSYKDRTFKNVWDSDATLRLAHDFSTPGEVCTNKAIFEYERPAMDVLFSFKYGFTSDDDDWETDVYPSEVREWLVEHQIQVLNVAGNAGVEFEPVVENFLMRTLSFRKLHAV